MNADNTAAFAIAVLAVCMAAATYLSANASGCANYTRNVMMYLTTGALVMCAVAEFASQYAVPWTVSLASGFALVVAVIAIHSVQGPVPQHALYLAIACFMGVSLVDIGQASPFLDGSLVLAVIIFAAVTATAMRFGDLASTRVTFVGSIAYMCSLLLYMTYLLVMIVAQSPIPAGMVIGAHSVFLALGCFMTLRAARSVAEKEAACETEGPQYPAAAVRLLTRLFVTISDVKAISKARI